MDEDAPLEADEEALNWELNDWDVHEDEGNEPYGDVDEDAPNWNVREGVPHWEVGGNEPDWDIDEDMPDWVIPL